MKSLTLALSVGLLSSACLIAGCSSAASDWTKASTQNTAEAYQAFLTAHPSDPHATEARALIAQLTDNTAWSTAKTANTAAGYQSYIDGNPQGSNILAARDALSAVQRTEAWQSAQSGDATALQDFVKKYPTGPESEQAQAKLKTLTGYRVQLASESSQDRAERTLAKLKTKVGDSVSGLDVVPPANGEKAFKVQSGGMSEEAAKMLCASLKKRVPSCQVQPSAS